MLNNLFNRAFYLLNSASISNSNASFFENISNNIYNYRNLRFIAKKNNDYEIAKRLLKHCIKLNQNIPFLYYYLGLCYLRTNQSNKAIDYFDEAILLKPNYVDAIIGKGIATQNHSEAVNLFTNAISIEPNYAFIYNQRASRYFSLGKNQLAKDDIHRFNETLFSNKNIQSNQKSNKINLTLLDKYNIKYFYHITHKHNVQNILKKGLYSHNYAYSYNLTKQNIANKDVVNKRASKIDTINHFFVNDYAPLFFNPKNPMLYYRKDIEDDLVIIAFDRDLIFYPYTIFTDGNAASKSTIFYNSLKDLSKLNWDCLNAKYWSDFPDGKRQRMAEVLVKDIIPNITIKKLYCNNQETLNYVNLLISNYEYVEAELNSSLFFN